MRRSYLVWRWKRWPKLWTPRQCPLTIMESLSYLIVGMYSVGRSKCIVFRSALLSLMFLYRTVFPSGSSRPCVILTVVLRCVTNAKCPPVYRRRIHAQHVGQPLGYPLPLFLPLRGLNPPPHLPLHQKPQLLILEIHPWTRLYEE